MNLLVRLFCLVFVVFLSGCVAPNIQYVTATAEVDPSLARIEMRRSRLSTGGKIKYYVLDTGAVVGDSGAVPKSTVHCFIPEAKRPLNIIGRTSDKSCGEGVVIKAAIDDSGQLETYSRKLKGREEASIRQSSEDGRFDCLLAPKPICDYGVEIGELGPGEILVWNRQPGPLKISIYMGGPIVGGSDSRRFFTKELETKAGETYYLKASFGKIVEEKESR